MPDQDLEMGGGGGGGAPPHRGGGGGAPPKKFRPFGPQFGLKLSGGSGTLVPFPGTATGCELVFGLGKSEMSRNENYMWNPAD